MNYNGSVKQFKYSFDEFIGIYENLFTNEECEKAIELFEKYHEFGFTYSRDGDINFTDDSSINVEPVIELEWGEEFISNFHDKFYNYAYPLYNNQYPILQRLRKHRSKFIKIQKTCPTQGYHVWHCEHDASQSSQNRVLSWILYLNDVEEGGETEFLYQSLRFKPKVGTLVLFPAYFTHVHRGNPPLSGVKYIATGWIEFLSISELQGASEIPDLNNLNKIKKILYQ